MEGTILVLFAVTEEQKRQLEQAAPGARFLWHGSGEDVENILSEAEVVFGNPPAPLLRRASRLKWLQLQSAGADVYTPEGVLPEGAALTNASGAYGPAVSEHMLAMLLMFLKNLHRYRDNQNAHTWKDEGSVQSLTDARVLIAGAGDIGGCFARQIQALGGYTLGIKRDLSEKQAWFDELHTMDALPRLLPTADVLASVLPGGAATRKIFNRDVFSRMKPGSVFLNCGRGGSVDQDALCEALEHGPMAGACLDVTDPEPLPSGHKLWTYPNVVITPHSAGGGHLESTTGRIFAIFLENLRRYVRGETLEHLVR